MKCAECNGNLKEITGKFTTKSKTLGEITIDNIFYTECSDCGTILLDMEMAEKVNSYKKNKEIELIKQLPVGDFMTVNEAIEILGITKQAFSKNNKIKRNFIHNIKIGNKNCITKSLSNFSSLSETGVFNFQLNKKNRLTVK